MAEYKGIDISNHNWRTEIDFAKVKASGVQAAMIKATEGVSYTDKYFEKMYNGCKNVGIKVGAYHYFRPNIDGKRQAEYFLSVIKGKTYDLKACCDLEEVNGVDAITLTQRAVDFMNTVKNAGIDCVFYSYASFADSHLKKGLGLENFGYWVAHLKVSKPSTNSIWSKVDGWQYSFTGSVPGITGDVDLDIFYDGMLTGSSSSTNVSGGSLSTGSDAENYTLGAIQSGYVSKTDADRVKIDDILTDGGSKYDLTSRVHDMQHDPAKFTQQHFKQDYVILIRKKQYYAITALKGEEAYEKMYQIDSFMSATTSISCSEVAAGKCNVTIMGNTRIICADKSDINAAGWDSYESLMEGWSYDISDSGGAMSTKGNYIYNNMIFDNISDMKKARYGWRIAEKCDFEPMDEIHIFAKSRKQKDGDKYKVRKIFFGYITSISKSYNGKNVPTISISADDHLKLLKISYIANTMALNYTTAIAGMHYDKDYADNIIIDDNALAAADDPEIGANNFYDNIFAGRYVYEIIQRCCVDAGIPESYLTNRIEKIKRIPFLPQVRNGLAVELFSSDVRDRLSYCKEAANKMFVEFFADEEGQIVLKIPNYTLGINQLTANNDFIENSWTSEEAKLVANGGNTTKTYEKIVTETVETTEVVEQTVYHTVVKGDTLWDITYKYFGDHKWSRVYDVNTDQIADPHWIYPGQKLRIVAGKTVTHTQQVERKETVTETVEGTVSEVTDKYIRVIEDDEIINFTIRESDESIANVFSVHAEVPLIQSQIESLPQATTRVIQDWNSIVRFGMRIANTVSTPLLNGEVGAVLFGTMLAARAASQRYSAQLTMIEDSTIRVGDPIRVFLYDEHPFKFNDGYQKYGKQQAIFYIEKIDRSISPANVSTMTLTLTAGRVMGMQSIYDKMYLLYKDYFTEPDPDELPFGYEEIMSSLDGSSGSSGTSSGQSWDVTLDSSYRTGMLTSNEDIIRKSLKIVTETTAEHINSIINKNGHGDGKMANMGAAFIAAAKEAKIDPVYLAAHAAWESGWGKSQIVRDKNNWFGIGAYNASAYSSAYSYSSPEEGIKAGAKWIAENYIWNSTYNQDTLYKMITTPSNHRYCIEDNGGISYSWANGIASIMKSFSPNGQINGGSQGLNSQSSGTSGGSAGGTALQNQIVEEAKKYLGVPYLWGGTTPAGFDCSGLCQYVYKKFGIETTRTTYTQWDKGKPVNSVNDLQPADLVFFSNLGHVGMYIGNMQYIHAPRTGDVVKISSLQNRINNGTYYGARRFI